MCWATTTGQGNPAGSCGRISSSVPGPPVDTPTSTMPSLSRDSGASAFSARTARTLVRSDSRAASPRDRRSLAEVAARTVETSACLILTMSSEMVPSGLWMKSTAPSSSASNVASAPALVSEETITTGFGRCTMMRERQVRPSISGMLMSSVITSGLNASSSRNASIPLRTASTVKSPSSSNNCTRWRRINAESSTISNLITASPLLLVLELGASYARAAPVSLRRPSARPVPSR